VIYLRGLFACTSFTQAVRTSRQNLAPHVMGPNEDELRGRDSRSGAPVHEPRSKPYPIQTPQHSMRTSGRKKWCFASSTR